jgi:putative ABC transport system ATP-binding protein
MTALELEGIGKAYPGSPPVAALDDISLTVAAGELVAVVGPSGSGKSSLLHICGTLDRPTSGAITVAGVPTGACSDDELAALRATHIGFVFQQFFLLAAQSALENVASGLLYRDVSGRDRMDRARQALADVGLDHRRDHQPGELSGGECQRVAIARALVGDPTFVLADEPTGSLDSRTGEGIVELLFAANQRGRTILVITHDAELAGLLDRVVTLRDGRIESDRSVR